MTPLKWNCFNLGYKMTQIKDKIFQDFVLDSRFVRDILHFNTSLSSQLITRLTNFQTLQFFFKLWQSSLPSKQMSGLTHNNTQMTIPAHMTQLTHQIEPNQQQNTSANVPPTQPLWNTIIYTYKGCQTLKIFNLIIQRLAVNYVQLILNMSGEKVTYSLWALLLQEQKDK